MNGVWKMVRIPLRLPLNFVLLTQGPRKERGMIVEAPTLLEAQVVVTPHE